MVGTALRAFAHPTHRRSAYFLVLESFSLPAAFRSTPLLVSWALLPLLNVNVSAPALMPFHATASARDKYHSPWNPAELFNCPVHTVVEPQPTKSTEKLIAVPVLPYTSQPATPCGLPSSQLFAALLVEVPVIAPVFWLKLVMARVEPYWLVQVQFTDCACSGPIRHADAIIPNCIALIGRMVASSG